MAKDLKAGFTGSPANQPEGLRKATKDATSVIKRETGAVAAGAADHPRTATGLVLGIGALAFAAGFILGRSSAERESFWG